MMKNNQEKKNKRILIIAPIPPPINGLSNAVQELISSKLSKVYTLKLINTGRNLQEVGIPGSINPQKILNNLLLILSVIVSLIVFHPHLVYLTLAQTRFGILRDTLILWFCQKTNTSTLVHLHGGGFRDIFEGLPEIERSFILKVLNKLAGAIVLSDGLKSIFKDLVPDERIFVVHNGVPCDHPQFEKKHDQNSSPHIVFLSNLYFEKGVLDSLSALKIIKNEGFNFSSTFGGPWISNNDKEVVKRFLVENQLNDRIKFPGLIIGNAKTDLLNSTDIFLFPTFYSREGQPIVIIEALKAGLPIISTPRASIPDMVVNGFNGFIVQENSPEEIAEKLRVLIQNKEMRREMGENSRQIYLREYTIENYISGIENVFRQLISE